MKYNRATIIFIIYILLVQLFGVKTSISKNKVYQAQVTFTEIYTNSAKYSITGITDIAESSNCRFVNSITLETFECFTDDNTCPCSSGILKNLDENNIYEIQIFHDTEQIGSKTLKTASIGHLTPKSGIDYINYTIQYKSERVAPFSCAATLIDLESGAETISESASKCQEGRFDNLSSNKAYELVITNNDSVMQTTVISTKFYTLSLTAVGLEAFTFSGEGNLDVTSSSSCSIVDALTNNSLNCTSDDGPCNCYNSIVTNLTMDTTYSLKLILDDSIISQFQLKTASQGIITTETFYNGISFNILYDDPDSIPTLCYPCTFDTFDGDIMSEQDCREWVAKKVFSPGYCKFYKYTEFVQNHYYKSYLFDSFGYLISSSDLVKVPWSQITHTSFQLTSINYLLDTELTYDTSRPCYILNMNQYKWSCEVDGINTTDCPCKEGIIINLPVNAYIYVELYQDDKLLAYDPKMYTADNGIPYVNSIGLYHFEYLISYFTNTYPPFQCQACLQDAVLGDNDCNDIDSFFGRDICRTYKWDGLKKANIYQLKIYDADHVLHTDMFQSTTDFPLRATFENLKIAIKYTLTYLNSSYTPINCHFFFEEDPTFEALCFDHLCDCMTGMVQVPFGTNYKKLLITDNDFELLAKVSSGDSIKLSVGAIAGISIFVIILIVIILASVLIVLRKKQSFQKPMRSYNIA